MITAEYAPFAKTGGLADMVAGLARELVIAGHDVRVLIPRYAAAVGGAVSPAAHGHNPARNLARGHTLDGVQVSPVMLHGTHPGYTLELIRGQSSAQPQLYALDAPDFFGTGGIYTGSDLDAGRFALLAHAALRLCEILEWMPDVLHCHDWHSALVPALLSSAWPHQATGQRPATVLTIHNIGYQGVFAGSLRKAVGLPATSPVTDLNFLREGIVAADALTTVSPTHATEILTPKYGMGLDPLLRDRRNALVGILNGVDYTAWDPATDPELPAQYGPADLAGKFRCRTELIKRTGLAAERHDGARVPLLGMVTRLASQKGLELVIEALPPLLHAQALQAVVLGQGEARYAADLHAMATSFPGQFSFLDAQDEAMARLIYSGADAFMVPSLYEPCGLTQLYALRYGAVPIVRETGGLKDTVRHFSTDNREGTGSVFKHADATGLTWAIGELLNWYNQPELWTCIQRNGMAEDFSWRHQAPHFEALYARLSAARA